MEKGRAIYNNKAFFILQAENKSKGLLTSEGVSLVSMVQANTGIQSICYFSPSVGHDPFNGVLGRHGGPLMRSICRITATFISGELGDK